MWWTRPRPSIRIGALAVATSMVVIACSGDGAEISQLEAALADAETENAMLSEDLASTQQELTQAVSSVSDSHDETARIAAELEAANEDVAGLTAEVADLKSTVRSNESESQRAIREAEETLKKSQDQVQALMLAYDDDLAAASDEVSQAAREFACAYGKEAAEAGDKVSAISSGPMLRAFFASDAYSSVVAESEAASSLMSFVSDPEDALNASANEILEAPAVDCWQREDTRANAVLYEHQGVLRDAVLDAACTEGASDLYTDSSIAGYQATAVYQDWELRMGYSEARSYVSSIEDRYGSLEAFLAVPESEIEAQDARCEEIRDLIEPKSSGTWNVGDEIKPGTWKAFDVSDCYWARLAEDGDIRANHFGDGLRLSANVSSSDGQFEISGCRFYYANP